MKTNHLHLIFILLSLRPVAFSQNTLLPGVGLCTLQGNSINASDLPLNDQTLWLFFWNIDDRESLEQMRELGDSHNFLKERNVKVIGICTSSSGITGKIHPLISALGIDFDVFIDKNNEFRRAMNVPDGPFTLLIAQSGDMSRHACAGTILFEQMDLPSQSRLASTESKK